MVVRGDDDTMTALVGKYFIGVHDGCMQSGIVGAAIDPRHYLVRFDDVIGFTHRSEWPASLAVVRISDIRKPVKRKTRG